MAHYGGAQGPLLQRAGLDAEEAPCTGLGRRRPDQRARELGRRYGGSPAREEAAQLQGGREVEEGFFHLPRRQQLLVVGRRRARPPVVDLPSSASLACMPAALERGPAFDALVAAKCRRSWLPTATFENEVPVAYRAQLFRGKMWDNADRKKYDKMISNQKSSEGNLSGARTPPGWLSLTASRSLTATTLSNSSRPSTSS